LEYTGFSFKRTKEKLIRPKKRSGVNFINVFRANFKVQASFQQLFSSYMYVEKQRLYEKFVRKMLMKLTEEVRREKEDCFGGLRDGYG